MRLRYSVWIGKYSYNLGGKSYVGTKVMMFTLTLTIANGGGHNVYFPTWWGSLKSDSAQLAHCCGTRVALK